MSVLRALAVVVGALIVQVVIGKVWPGGHRFLDVLIVPVIWYGVAGTQRAAMLVGCLAGLVHDAWFELPFGVYGFKWTLIGWVLAGISRRLDLNHPGGRFFAGAAAWLVDSLLDPGLRRLVDLESLVRHPTEIVAQSVLTGLLAVLAGSIVERARGRMPTPKLGCVSF